MALDFVYVGHMDASHEGLYGTPMDEDLLPADPHNIIPRRCGDILTLAEQAIERYREDPTILNLYPMVLLSSHVADWYVHADLDLPDARFVADFGRAYPKWSAIRSLGNGLKHTALSLVSVEQFASEDMAWEHPGWWDGIAYGADFNGQKVPVDGLCWDFTREFSGDLVTGRIRDELPGLHAAADAKAARKAAVSGLA